jgi:hypothetical protein
MTSQEFKNEFLIHYNAIATSSAPGLDDYEISVFLTKAQLEIVKNYYDPLSNRKQKGFESSEKRRVDLKELIRSYSTSTSFNDSDAMHSQSKFFSLPLDVFLIIHERVKVTSTDCNNGKTLTVRPITHDNFNAQINNPFRRPDLSGEAWRLDNRSIAGTSAVEIISPFNLNGTLQYTVRYIKYPRPIILGNLTTLFPEDNLSIDGITVQTSCELSHEVHREILDRAVEIALRDYKPQGLESKIQMDIRNE